MANYRQSGFSFPPAIRNLIIINVIVWLVEVTVGGSAFVNLFSLHDIRSSEFKFFQYFTYMFLHDPGGQGSSGITHILFNMFALWMFGSVLENYWGSRRFLNFYLICGVGAALIYSGVMYFHNSNLINAALGDAGGDSSTFEFLRARILDEPILGASGAIFGVLVAFGYTFPNTEMIIIPIPFPVKAKYLVIGYVLIELFAGVSNRSGDNVAHFAHLGGALVGFVMIRLWNRKNRRDFY